MRKKHPHEFWPSLVAEGDCLVWKGRRTINGYGQLMRMGKTWIASRYAWHITFGPIPDGMHVCHKCDNPPCCNPGHLFLGTHADNMRDKMNKGRHVVVSGEEHWKAVLSDEEVRLIRSLVFFYGTKKKVAQQFGVKPSVISQIIGRKNRALRAASSR